MKHLTLSLPEPVESRNFFHLVIEIAWFAVALASTSRFLQFYAIRLGANAFELGLLTSIPSIVLMFSVTFSRWWRARNPDSIRAVWWPGMVFRFMFLLPVFAPMFPPHLQIPWLIAAAIIPSMGQGVASAIFVVMMRETVPSNRMNALMARRQLALNIMLTIGAIFFGLMLERIVFPLNYQLMFGFSFVMALLSQWHLSKIQMLMPDPVAKPKKVARSMRETFQLRSFQSVAYITAIAYIGYFAIFPLVPLHLKVSLGAEEGFMAIFGVVELISGALVTLVLQRLIHQYGSRTNVVFGMVGAALAVLVIALSPNIAVALVGAALTGASWTLVSVAVLSFFTERTEPDDMQASTLWHQVVFGAMFVGPMIGSGIASLPVTLTTVLIVGAGLRLLTAVLAHYGLSIFTGKRVEPIHNLRPQ